MRSLLLAGLLGMLVGFCPRPGAADQVSEIFLEFPELAEWGRPVMIGGYEFWQPHPAYLPVAWEPYRSGYLYDDPTEGLTWISEDPWGFITEHYGYWRHHEVYGFVWRPLYPIQWRPYVASMFRDGGGRIIGWCPFYYDAWDHGYYLIGFGFNDYYWAPFWNRVHYVGFYDHHWWRFHGYYTAVTICDSNRYWRPVPGPHHRRDREYRHRRESEGPGRGRDRSMTIRSALPSQSATPVRRRSASAPPSPSRPPRAVEVPAGELRTLAPGTPRPAQSVSAPARPAATPARQSAVARERVERMQLLRDRMQSSRPSAVASPRPAERATQPRAFTPAPAPQRSSAPAPQRSSAPALSRGNLQMPQPRSASPSLSRPSAPAPRRSADLAPRPGGASHPVVRPQPRQEAASERARRALPVQRKSNRDGS